MIYGLRALILWRGNVVRSDIARPSTVARYLTQVSPLADYEVRYYYRQQPHRVTAEGFLALYETGRIMEPQTMKEAEACS
jgi:hypothetical protein